MRDGFCVRDNLCMRQREYETDILHISLCHSVYLQVNMHRVCLQMTEK